MTTVKGVVRNTDGDGLGGVDVAFFSPETETPPTILRTAEDGGYSTELDAANIYTWVALEDGYLPESGDYEVPRTEGSDEGLIIVVARDPDWNAGNGSPPASPPADGAVEELQKQLDRPEFSIEAPVSIAEANQAVGLFSVVNLMLGGLGNYTLAGSDKVDFLGMQRLYYGLADRSLSDRLVVQNTDRLWRSIEGELKGLSEDLDRLQVDVDFLGREGKRQFNLGTDTNVVGKAEFPPLFRRFVDLATDPLAALDVEVEERSEFSDKTRVQEAYDLLRRLKDTVLDVVRSLSKSGSAATGRVTRDWADFEGRALNVLKIVAEERVSDDLDEMTAWAVLSVLIERRRDTIIPYVALSRHGAKLLRYAVDIYLDTQNNLEGTDRQHLKDLFQAGGSANKESWWTTRLRKEADIVKKHPLANWG